MNNPPYYFFTQTGLEAHISFSLFTPLLIMQAAIAGARQFLSLSNFLIQRHSVLCLSSFIIDYLLLLRCGQIIDLWSLYTLELTSTSTQKYLYVAFECTYYNAGFV